MKVDRQRECIVDVWYECVHNAVMHLHVLWNFAKLCCCWLMQSFKYRLVVRCTYDFIALLVGTQTSIVPYENGVIEIKEAKEQHVCCGFFVCLGYYFVVLLKGKGKSTSSVVLIN